MKLYNTLSARTEPFSAAGDSVSMYVCGITPYAPSHVGHAMSSVVFDVVRRYLEFKGYKVRHVQNFTDIDDKMIAAASRMSISTKELAGKNIENYLSEMDSLNVLRAHDYPRATQEVPKIQEMIGALVDRGYAYAVDGDVYFRVHKAAEYGKLSHRSRDSLMTGARVEVREAKEDPMDFALWKGQKSGEPAWDSPWGPGRPGWHIECSAMSLSYLGETLDIHGGGQDLVFPHHENEIAQSESYTQKTPFARFWLHNGLIRQGEDKMSKSLGNMVAVHGALDRHSPDALRLFFLSSHYRSPLTYSHEAVEGQERALERLRNAVTRLGRGGDSDGIDAAPFRDRFVEAMDDDLNTPRAVAVLFDLARDMNRGQEAGRDVSKAQSTLRELAGILGLTLERPAGDSETEIGPMVELLIETREQLRAAKHYDLADRIRQRLADLGIALEDTPSGTEWKRRLP